MKSKNVTFIYKSGRKSRLSSNQEFPKEFFYGYHQFLKNFKNVNLIEYNEKVNIIFKFIFKVIRKLSGLPIYSEKLLSIKNIKLLIKTDYLILTNQNIGYSYFSNRCTSSYNGVFFYWDDDHLTRDGASLLVNNILDLIY